MEEKEILAQIFFFVSCNLAKLPIKKSFTMVRTIKAHYREILHILNCRMKLYSSKFLYNHDDGLFIYAYELMLCLHVFRQTGPPRRVDCLAPPSVCHIKTEASR